MKRLVALSLLLLLVLGLAGPAGSQGPGLYVRTDCTTITAPVTGQTWCFDATAKVPKVWDGSAFVVTTGVPSGTIVLLNGACPSGYTEVTASQGRFLVAAPAGGTIGGTKGSAIADLADSSFTPLGSVAAPTFSGSALAGHTHTVTLTNNAQGNLGGNDTAASGVYTSSSVSGGTPAGTNSVPAFTGTANSTMRSTVSPYIQLRLCQAP